MNEIKSIAFIGATGKLAIPVVKILAENGFSIRAIVRNVDKAKQLLPSNVEIVFGNLNDSNTIDKGLQNMDAVYINLSTETANLKLPFYEEREGVKNIVEAAKKNNVKYIYKIGAMGAYPKANHIGTDMAVPNIIRLQGQKYIEQSGINYTIFDPTMFIDNIVFQIKGKSIQWIGNSPAKFYWITAGDFAKQVLNAINNPSAINKHYPIQGIEALSTQEVFKIFIDNYDTNLKVQIAPLWLVKLIGLFNSHMKFLGHLFSYFGKIPDPFYATETWQELGKPTTTVKQFAQQLKNKK